MLEFEGKVQAGQAPALFLGRAIEHYDDIVQEKLAFSFLLGVI